MPAVTCRVLLRHISFISLACFFSNLHDALLYYSFHSMCGLERNGSAILPLCLIEHGAQYASLDKNYPSKIVSTFIPQSSMHWGIVLDLT